MATATFGTGLYSSANTATYDSTTYTPAAGDLLVVYFHISGTANPNLYVSSDTRGLGFVKVADTTFTSAGAAGRGALFVAARFAPALSEIITCNTSSDNGTGAAVLVWAISGMGRTGSDAVRQVALENSHAAGTPAPTFPINALTDNLILGFVGDEGGAPPHWTPPSGFTEPASGEGNFTAPAVSAETCNRDSGFTGTTVTWGNASTGVFSSLIAEFDTTPALRGTEITARARTSRPFIVAGPRILGKPVLAELPTAPPGDVTIAAPAATATATGLAPTIQETVLPAVADSTASALGPNVLVVIPPATATATADALVPTLILIALGDTTSHPRTPVLLTPGGPPILIRQLLAEIAAVVPQDVTITPAVATATALANIPTLIVTVLPAVAGAAAAGLVPTLGVRVLPAVSTATAAGLVPTLKVTLLPAVATATATALVPTLQITIAPAVATATATAPAPTLVLPITILAPVATATASGLVPTIVTIIIFIDDVDSAVSGMQADLSTTGSDSDSAISGMQGDSTSTGLQGDSTVTDFGS